jgi:hypothetical protein
MMTAKGRAKHKIIHRLVAGRRRDILVKKEYGFMLVDSEEGVYRSPHVAA